jgi:hypothetical protein
LNSPKYSEEKKKIKKKNCKIKSTKSNISYCFFVIGSENKIYQEEDICTGNHFSVPSTQIIDKKKQNDGMKVVASNVAKHDCDVELTVYSKFINLQNSKGAILLSHFTSTFIHLWRDQAFLRMPCFERASPALKDILLKQYR